MAGKTNPKKLPSRYPRDREICIFEDLSVLDERFGEIEKELDDLIKLQPEETYSLEKAASIFSHLKFHLIKAFIEFERFYQDEIWSFETDYELKGDLESVSDWIWRVRELEHGRLIETPAHEIQKYDGTFFTIPSKLGRLYEPATLACAKAIYIVLFMSEIVCDADQLKQFKFELKYWLTHYYAGCLELTSNRNNRFTDGGRPQGSISTIKRYMTALYDLQDDGIRAKEFHRVIQNECLKRTVHRFKSIALTQYIESTDSIEYRENGKKPQTVKLETITEKYGLKFPKGKD